MEESFHQLESVDLAHFDHICNKELKAAQGADG